MTQDQRYDMITEMYEATRYAKEMHKKNKDNIEFRDQYDTIYHGKNKDIQKG